MNVILPKLKTNKNNEELKIYMYVVQGGPIKIDIPEDFKAVMAYNDNDAINMVRKDYPAGLPIFIKKKAQVDISKVLDAVDLQATAAQDLKIHVTPPEPRQKSVRDFVYGMMLVADKYITNKRDQSSMKRILKKINLIDEDKTITEPHENVA